MDIGEVLYEAISENVTIETAPWAVERAARVLDKLHGARDREDKFSVIIPWIEMPIAFTAPGQYIFISRQLFQHMDSDDMVAMIVAHEMSHHDLGHIKKLPEWISHLDAKVIVHAFYRNLASRLYGPEQECDADRNALELCVRAGYDGMRCIKAFNVLEKFLLDFRNASGVYGTDEELDGSLDEASWMAKAEAWLQQRRRGYLPLRDRRTMLQEHLRRLSWGPPVKIPIVRLG